ncbi:TolC family protein [Pseudoalteromonas fenneropenaei]|uniref:TolC family protein n=1 Tax=Pseudoalteromonas fenneropenaei TaxID=1737459 RepID=A0ABV7CG37_9GAMM
MMKSVFKMPLLAIALAGFYSQASLAVTLPLSDVIATAQQHDLWQQSANLKAKALAARSTAANTQPDPTVSLGLMNLPTDGFAFNQEAMTQLKIGVNQMFARGDSLQHAQQQLLAEAGQVNWQQAERSAQVALQVTELWLDAVRAKRAMALVVENKALFAEMLAITKASYASALGKTRQQDVIRAELELLQLDERIAQEQQKLETATARLASWLQANTPGAEPVAISIPSDFPKLSLTHGNAFNAQPQLVALLQQHPALHALQQGQKRAEQGIKLAEAQYQPQWGVNASYAYRDDAPTGMSRSDFLSVGVSFDVPLFTQNRQDQWRDAALAEAEMSKTQIQLQLKAMLGQVYAEYANLKRLYERQQRFNSQLLTQSQDQAEATLTAYTHDDGEFSEVVRARSNVLQLQLAELNIHADALKSVAKLNYFLDPNVGQFTGAKP